MPENPNPSVPRLRALPILVTENLFVVTINQSHLPPAELDSIRVAVLLPGLAIASHFLAEFPKIAKLIKPLDLASVVSHIDSISKTKPAEEIIAVDQKSLRDLYSLFADLDRSNASDTVYRQLRDLPIWKSGHGLVKATQALLPGNFTDPTGQANLLDTSVFTEPAKRFLSEKLEIPTQTIKTFVRTVLPTRFDDNGPLDATKYSQLISELADHRVELENEDDICRLLGSLPIVPVQDKRWSSPINTYRRTDELVKVLGDDAHLWLDADRIPNVRSIHSFIDSLGIQRSPIARHLVDRMLSLAEKYPPTEDAKRASSEAFYALCDHYEKWKEEKAFQNILDDLRQAACFPADGDTKKWHTAKSLHAPYRAEAFRSQAAILDFKNTNRLKTELLEELDISINPQTQLVIGHLRHCIEEKVQPPTLTYQVLNERASEPLIATLKGSQCIYVKSQKMFVCPNRVYWVPQYLGRFTYTLPSDYMRFKPLFDAIEVKDTPDSEDFVDILLGIVEEYFVQCKPVTGEDRTVYGICLKNIALAHEHKELALSDLQRLREAPTILNLLDRLTYPDEVLLHDSEWHVKFFGGELDHTLCKPEPELWAFIKELGVRRLSERAQVTRDFVSEPQTDESSFAEKLMERIDILARLLHDKPTIVRKKIREALVGLTVVSADIVRVQASVYVGEHPTDAPPVLTQAFYDIENRCLVLAHPVNDRSWVHLLNALFHPLMPDESGGDISKLASHISLLMDKSVEEAHQQLSDAGIPSLDAEIEGVENEENLVSPVLGEIGTTTETGSNTVPPTLNGNSGEGEACSGNKESNQPTGNPDTQPRNVVHGEGQSTAKPTNLASGSSSRPDITKKRPKHKNQRDQRLLSYVLQKQEGTSETGGQELSEHNLAVEVMARGSVCTYEEERGRVPEQMAQTHPGYDIISRDPMTGKKRLIEVKGVNGEWNQTGVGLSHFQFSNAQDYGDCYWLYVVEFASDPELRRVHAIQNPATKVTAFMFDGNWRDVATEEQADPSLRFIPGARIHHDAFGCGEIRDVVTRGNTKLLTILFDGKSQATPNVSLNLHSMRILKDADGDDDS
jgi:hypothetical protein